MNETYDEWVDRWRELWEKIDPLTRATGEWSTPWLDESWRDGNPIFSAVSRSGRRALRVLWHEETKDFGWRLSVFDRDGPDEMHELVLKCGQSTLHLAEAFARISEWVEHGTVTEHDRSLAA